MALQFIGTVKVITPIENGASAAGKQWSRCTIVLEEVGSEYPQSIAIGCFNKAISELTDIKPGMVVQAFFNIKAVEKAGKWFSSLSLYKLHEASSAAQQQPMQFPQPQYQQPWQGQQQQQPQQPWQGFKPF